MCCICVYLLHVFFGAFSTRALVSLFPKRKKMPEPRHHDSCAAALQRKHSGPPPQCAPGYEVVECKFAGDSESTQACVLATAPHAVVYGKLAGHSGRAEID